jgi:hypothetical protein
MPGVVVKAETYDGDYVETKTGRVIGTVKNYNPATRTAGLVTLFSMPDLAEPGTIEAGCEVRRAPQNKPKPMKVQQATSDDEAFSDEEDEED